MVFQFLPRQDPFLKGFEEAAALMRRAALLLQEIVEDFEHVDQKLEQMREVEEQADRVSHDLIARLNRTFITPIDRNDIINMIRALDQVTDFVYAAAARMAMYNIGQPTDAARQFARLILTGVEGAARLMAMLHRKDFAEMREPMRQIGHAENEGDQLLWTVVAGLFRSGQDPLTVIKWKEIYEVMEDTTDKLEHLAHLVQGVVVKNT